MDLNSDLQRKIHQINMIENIQKAFTKYIKGFSSFSYQKRLSILKIYSLQRRRERYIIIYVWGESDVPACGPPASFSIHLACSAVTPAGSVHKSRGDNVVRMWVQLKR